MDIGLARVSSLDQNPQLQLDALSKAGCWPIYEERASGVAAKRPVRDQVLRELNAGDRLTTWKLDRVGRSIIELHQIVEGLKARGIAYRSLTEAIDTSTGQGRFFFALLAAFAEFERNMIIERTRAGKAQRVASGQHPGGHRMFGYELDRVTEIPREADLLRAAARHVLDGGSLGRLIDEWNRRQVPTKSGKGRWSETMVRRMLANPRAVGIVGAKAQLDLARLFAPASDRRRMGAPAVHLLSGILVCGGCEQPMYAATQHGDRKDLTYRCHAPTGGRYSGCGRVSVMAAPAERWIGEAFVAAVASGSFAQALNERRAALLEGGTTAEQVEDWRAEVGELETILGTRYGTDAHRVRRDELQRMVRQATARLLQRPDLQALLDLPRSEAALSRAWDGWDTGQRRRHLKLLVERVRVLPVGGTGRRFDGRRLDPDWRI